MDTLADRTVTLSLTGDPAKRDFATLYITIGDSKGLMPMLRLNPSTSTAASIVQPVPNEGADPDHPKAQFPWVGNVNAQAVGSATIEVWSDGSCTDSLPLTVLPQQTAKVQPNGIVITKAGS